MYEMKELVNKFVNIERTLSVSKGPFSLFALFLREDAPGVWDLVVAAPWLYSDKQEGIRIISEAMGDQLSQEDLKKLSRIVIIDWENPALEGLHQAIQTEHSPVEMKDSNFFGLQIKRAFLITSVRESEIQTT